jgi:hypothetical protein
LAFVNFYLETVLKPFGDSTKRIMTGFFEVSQLGLPAPQIASNWGGWPQSALDGRFGFKPIAGQ